MRIASHLSRIAGLLSASLVATSLATAAPVEAQDRSLSSALRPTPQQDWLDAHNAARADLGLGPLIWDHDLERDARAWANHLSARGTFSHASDLSGRQQGENLWLGTRNRFAPRDMVGAWLAEQRYFRPGTFPDVSRTKRWSDVGHYTQIIWPSTRKVGCAVAPNSRNEVLVCRYWPAGNVIGERLDPAQHLSRR